MGLLRKNTLKVGLVSSYNFDGNSNDAVNGNNGTDTAISYVSGKIGQAASFNGTSSRILVGTTSSFSYIQNTGIFTIAFWVKPTNYATTQYFMGNGGLNNSQKGFYVGIESGVGQLRIYIVNGSGSAMVNAVYPNYFTDNTWRYVTIVGNGTNVLFYRDGVYLNTTALGATTSGNSSNILEIGKIAGLASYYNGLIDSTQFYQRALQPSEVSLLYNSTNGIQFPFDSAIKILTQNTLKVGLVSSYNFDGNSNDAVNGNNGTDTAISYVSGKIGQAASFNGTSSRITRTATSLSTSAAWTINFWINPTNFSNAYSRLFNNGGGGVGIYADTLRVINLYLGPDYYGPTLTYGVWQMVSIAVNANTVSWFLNGSFTTSYAIISSTISLSSIGGGGGVFGFNGLLDAFSIYNRALKPSEIALLYNSGNARQFPFSDITKILT